MTYQEYEVMHAKLMQTFLQVRYPAENIPGTIITSDDLTPDAVVNQIADLEDAHPAYARRQLDEIPTTITLDIPAGTRINIGLL
jgi:hypothetical protein